MDDARSDDGPYAKGPEAPPVAAHATLLLGYISLFGGLLLRAARRGALPRGIPLGDVLLIGAATFELARLITRDEVTDAVRAPFTRLDRKVGAAEVHESPKGRGLRRALGELLTCPYCAAPWVASSFMTAYVGNPRLARTVAAPFAIAAMSDVSQQLYALLRRAS